MPSQLLGSTQTLGAEFGDSESEINGHPLQPSRSQVSIPRPRLAQLSKRTEFLGVRPPMPKAEAPSDTQQLVALRDGHLGGVLRCSPMHAKELEKLAEAFARLLLLQDKSSAKWQRQ